MQILNIGLATRHGGKLDPRAVYARVSAHAPGTVACGPFTSDTESTLVLIVPDLTTSQIHRLALHFAQDCIAVYDPRTKLGRLIGDAADAWGDFTPRYFIMPDGVRLGAE